MKDRYDSEKNIKKAFDNFEMPFDNAAFEKFSVELDKEEKRRKFIWWIFFGKYIAPILVLGAIGFVVFSENFFTLPQSSQELVMETSNTNDKSSSTIAYPSESKIDLAIEKNSSTINVFSENDLEESKLPNPILLESKEQTQSDKPTNPKTTDLDSNISERKRASKNVKQKTSAIQNNTITSNDTNETISTNYEQQESLMNPNLIHGTGKEDQIGVIKDGDIAVDQKQTIGSLQVSTSEELDSEHMISKEILSFPTLPIRTHQLDAHEKGLYYPGEIVPYKEKFKGFFYFNLGLGFSIDDNLGTYDQFFSYKFPKELIFKGALAYQLTKKTGLEFTYASKNLSLGYDLRDVLYSQKVGSRINIMTLSGVHKLASFKNSSSLYFTAGVSLLLASKDFNIGPDFGKGVIGVDVPNSIKNVSFDWEGLYSNNHFSYSSGFRFDYPISSNLDLLFDATYTFGTKLVMRLDVNYIEGEGIKRKMETSTNGSFASFTIGLKYRMRQN